jgi:hypothetical protein
MRGCTDAVAARGRVLSGTRPRADVCARRRRRRTPGVVFISCMHVAAVPVVQGPCKDSVRLVRCGCERGALVFVQPSCRPSVGRCATSALSYSPTRTPYITVEAQGARRALDKGILLRSALQSPPNGSAGPGTGSGSHNRRRGCGGTSKSGLPSLPGGDVGPSGGRVQPVRRKGWLLTQTRQPLPA